MDVSPLDFGAVADGKTLCTKALQAAIDAVSAAGGGRVACPAGVFLTGTLTLRSHVELHLAPGCRLQGSTDLAHYESFGAPDLAFLPTTTEGCTQCLVRATDAEDIAITGPGEINGAGPAFYDTSDTSWGGCFYRKPPTPRPRLVMMYRCRRVRFADASFVDSPCWTFWLICCEQVAVRGIRVQGDQRMINNDGIDFDACRDVTVSDSLFRTGDDCLVLRNLGFCRTGGNRTDACENIVVANCVLDSWCQGVRIGCPGDGIIRHARFSNLVVTCRGNGVATQNPQRYVPSCFTTEGPLDVSDIAFDNVAIDSGGHPVRIDLWEGFALRRLGGMRFSHCRFRGKRGIRLQGTPATPVQGMAFHDVQVETPDPEPFQAICCDGLRLDGVEFRAVGTGG
ncbi:MAG: glycoside hydrolase family 28 protein [Kiritimatiellia bacterium]|jgi:polygalacturonase